MSAIVTVNAARADLSRLIDRAAGGEDIIISRAGRPVARLAPVSSATTARRPGLLRGRLRMSRDFDAPLSPDELAAFYGVVPAARARRR